eukprot:Hpha_TRINITY_DN15624_c4_g7::TRINITY_DN15624_c4_g7_i1::g.99249::m.99249
MRTYKKRRDKKLTGRSKRLSIATPPPFIPFTGFLRAASLFPLHSVHPPSHIGPPVIAFSFPTTKGDREVGGTEHVRERGRKSLGKSKEKCNGESRKNRTGGKIPRGQSWSE